MKWLREDIHFLLRMLQLWQYLCLSIIPYECEQVACRSVDHWRPRQFRRMITVIESATKYWVSYCGISMLIVVCYLSRQKKGETLGPSCRNYITHTTTSYMCVWCLPVVNSQEFCPFTGNASLEYLQLSFVVVVVDFREGVLSCACSYMCIYVYECVRNFTEEGLLELSWATYPKPKDAWYALNLLWNFPFICICVYIKCMNILTSTFVWEEKKNKFKRISLIYVWQETSKARVRDVGLFRQSKSQDVTVLNMWPVVVWSFDKCFAFT